MYVCKEVTDLTQRKIVVRARMEKITMMLMVVRIIKLLKMKNLQSKAITKELRAQQMIRVFKTIGERNETKDQLKENIGRCNR